MEHPTYDEETKRAIAAEMELERTAFDDPLRPVARPTQIAIGMAATASALPSAAYIHQTLGADGTQLLDIALTGLLSCALYTGILANHAWGMRVLAEAPAAMRKRMVGPFWAVCLGLSAISMGTGIIYIALPAAQQAENLAILEGVDEDIARIDGVLVQAQAAATILENSESKGLTVLAAESGAGAICQSGAGPGPCVSVIQGLLAETRSARGALSQIDAEAAPLRRELEATRAEIAQAMANERVPQWAKSDALQAGVERLGVILERLQGLVPLQVLETAAVGLGKPFDQLGITADGARRLKTDFAPYAHQLDAELAEVRAALATPLVKVAEKTQLQTVIDNFGSVAFMVFILAALDLVPLALIALFIAAAPYRHAGSSPGRDHDDDLPPPSIGPRPRVRPGLRVSRDLPRLTH